MSASAATTHIATRKTHACSLCCAVIELGQKYSRWRYYHEDGACTVIVHPDCYTLWKELTEEGSEWGDGDLRWAVDEMTADELIRRVPLAADSAVGAVWMAWRLGVAP